MNYAPVAVFGYKRHYLLSRCLSSLANCLNINKRDIYIFIDGPKNVTENKDIELSRKIANKYCAILNNVTLEMRESNLGLGKSIITGVTALINKYQKIIVIEDDLILDKNILNYFDESLSYYNKYKNIGSISAFGFKINNKFKKRNYFHYRASTWGWATWDDRWKEGQWEINKDILKNSKIKQIMNVAGQDMFRMLNSYLNGNIDSWGIRWAYTHRINNWLVSYPFYSLIENNGYDDYATNCANKDKPPIGNDPNNIKFLELEDCLEVNSKIKNELNWYHSNIYKIFMKIANILKLK